ncbi:MAG: DUF6580 family putative transport protein [Candidatus Saccharibacteria bacterium]
MTKKNMMIKNISLTICLVVLAVGWRIINNKYQVAPNLEIITAVSVIAAISVGWRAALIVPVTSMVISDVLIGNSSIFMFTWGAFAIIGLGATFLRRFNKKPKSQILYSFGFAVVSSFTFFVITNFGVWLQGWYPATITGLIDCFVMAVPFYRTMLIGNLILVPAALTAFQLVKNRAIVRKLVVNSFIR